ncbi:MAG: LysM peptidoglycan-binding domain-containing protein [Hyphomonadaceae bacterium]|nr:LysM peptidoglycan-binding domain-containing protein [Hyphomonadaceae bacterium]
MGYVGNNGNYDVTYERTRHLRQTPGGSTGSFADYDLAYDQITSYEQGSRGGMYTVRAGDTLPGIAAALWGDASLWYKLAEVNGLTGESALIEGQPLIVPVGVVRSENNATTFKPYDPLEVLGNTSPTAPKPHKQQCGGMGQVLLVVIAMVVQVVLDRFIPGAGKALSKAMTAAVNIGRSAAIGAAASATSQAVGVATGIQDKFSWNAVAMAAISSGIVASPLGETVARATGVGNGFAKWFVTSAVEDAAAQAIGTATGLQKDFSWAGVAAAGLTGGVLQGRGGARAVGARVLIEASMRSLIEGEDFGDAMLAALPGALGQYFGKTIGEQIADALSPEPVAFEPIKALPDLAQYEPTALAELPQLSTMRINLARAPRTAYPLDGWSIDLTSPSASEWSNPFSAPAESGVPQTALQRLLESGALESGYSLTLNQGDGASPLGVAPGFVLTPAAIELLRGTAQRGALAGGAEVAAPATAIAGAGLLLSYAAVADHGAPLMIPNTSLMHPDSAGRQIGNMVGAMASDDLQLGFGVVVHSREEASLLADMQLQGASATEINSALDRLRGRSGTPTNAPTTDEIRSWPGVAYVSGDPLPVIDGPWLFGGEGAIPGQVADRLAGRRFESIHDFRGAFWRTVADIPELADQFTESNRALMRQGKAPFPREVDQYGDRQVFEIHHPHEVRFGGALYDMNNMRVVSPRRHNEIHYGENRR